MERAGTQETKLGLHNALQDAYCDTVNIGNL